MEVNCHPGFKPISTERLLIRELAESDVSLDYVRWLQDPEVNRFTEVRNQLITLDYVAAAIRHARKAKDSAFLGIFVRESEQHIGTIHITRISPIHQTAVTGFLIGEKRFWGQGLGTEAITAVSELLLHEVGLRKITAGCYDGNHSSARTLLKSGFIQEATLRAQLVADSGCVDELRFARFAENYEPATFEVQASPNEVLL